MENIIPFKIESSYYMVIYFIYVTLSCSHKILPMISLFNINTKNALFFKKEHLFLHNKH